MAYLYDEMLLLNSVLDLQRRRVFLDLIPQILLLEFQQTRDLDSALQIIDREPNRQDLLQLPQTIQDLFAHFPVLA